MLALTRSGALIVAPERLSVFAFLYKASWLTSEAFGPNDGDVR